MLRFEKVRFSYPGRPVFDGLDLTLPDGSRTALLAPSGTGKTTLLRLLTGQLRPQSGAVTRTRRPASAWFWARKSATATAMSAGSISRPVPE